MTHDSKHELLAALLAAGLTQQQAAQAAGRSRASVTRALREPEFRALVERYEAGAARRVSRRLDRLCDDALGTLTELLGCKAPAVRARVALGVLDHAARSREQVDLEERVAALEARTTGNGRVKVPAWT